MGAATDALQVVQRLSEAWNAQDWETYGALFHEDATYELLSQVTAHGRADIIEHEQSIRLPGMNVTRDLYTADDSGRVWWRYTGEWPDPESGEQRSTSGASTALVTDGAIISITSWIDLSFMLPGPDDAGPSESAGPHQ